MDMATNGTFSTTSGRQCFQPAPAGTRRRGQKSRSSQTNGCRGGRGFRQQRGGKQQEHEGIPWESATNLCTWQLQLRSGPETNPEVVNVRESREEPPQRAQDVLAFGDPGDRLDVQRVDREQRGHDSACREPARHSLEQHEQQDRVQRVQGDVDEVGRARRHAEQLDVEHVRDPRQWSAGRGKGFTTKGPARTLGRQSTRHVRVLDDERGVVIVDELKVAYWSKDNRDEYDQRGGGK